MKLGSAVLRVLAVVVVVGAVTAAVLVYQRVGTDAATETGPPADRERVTESATVPVVVASAERRRFVEAIEVQGNLQSRNYALVSPKIGGVLEAIYVHEGDAVAEGETRLFQTDSVKLQKAIDIARQNLKVAQLSQVESRANLEKTEAERAKVASDYQRYKSLYERSVVSEGAYEEMESAFRQLEAMKTHAESVVAVAEEQARSAEIALAVAEKDLRDSLVVAPLSGVVSARMAEPGEMGEVGKPVVRIDDVTDLEASTFLPGQYYPRVVPGATKVRIGAGGEWWADYDIRYKSPTVDPNLRTFEIRCDVQGDGMRAVPGALVQMEVVLESREALGVPTDAIVRRANRQVVFVAQGDKAGMRTVETGLRTDGWSEVTAGEVAETDAVIVMGQFLLNDGSAIRLQERAE